MIETTSLQIVWPAAACYAMAYLVGILAFLRLAAHRRLATEGIMKVMAVALIAGIVGAIATQRLTTGQPGKTVLGGIACGYVAVVLFKRRIGLLRPTGDMFAVGISAGEAVGRWGCYFAGCCYGKACSLPWAIRQHGALRHPTQIYMSVTSAAILAVLLLYAGKRPPENAIFYLQGTLYCATRFVIEFYREGPRLSSGLTVAQIACIVGFGLFGTLLALRVGPATARAIRES